MSDSIEVKLGKLEERVWQQHTHIRERLDETISLFARQNTKVDSQLAALTRDVKIVTWTLGTIGVLVSASQTGVLDAIKLLLGGM